MHIDRVDPATRVKKMRCETWSERGYDTQSPLRVHYKCSGLLNVLQLLSSPFLPYRSYKAKLTTSSAPQGSSQARVTAPIYTYHIMVPCRVATVGTPLPV